MQTLKVDLEKLGYPLTMRRRQLNELGLTDLTIRALVESKSLEARVLPGCVYSHYLRTQVEQILNGNKE